jgi:nicotinamidase-related amidase
MGNMVELRRAFEEKRLGVVAVDLQKGYYTDNTNAAYPVANSVAVNARIKGVPNHWVAFTRDWAVRSPREFAHKYAHTRIDFHETIDVAEDEWVFEKAAQGAFDTLTPLLFESLRDKKIDTIAVTGVIHSACVTETIAGALLKGFNVFALADATDCHQADVGMWKSWILHMLGDDDRAPFLTVTNSHNFKQALQPA